MGDLAVGLLTGDHDDSPSEGLDESGVVGGLVATRVRGAQYRCPKCLWRLHGYQRRTRRRVDDDVVGIDPLDGVGHRDSGHGGIGTFADGANDRREQLRRCEWARGIVHAHDCRAEWHSREAGAYRLAACRPTGNAALRVYVGRRNDHDHAITGVASGADSMIDDPARADMFVLFGTTETRPRASGDHDGPDILSCGERHDRRG